MPPFQSQQLGSPFLSAAYSLQTRDVFPKTSSNQLRSYMRNFADVVRKSRGSIAWKQFGISIAFFTTLTVLVAGIGCFLGGRSRRLKRGVLAMRTINTEHCQINLDNKSPQRYTTRAFNDSFITSRTNRIMANNVFRGRELEAYKKEVREKGRRRRARGVHRSSQTIELPIQARHLRHRMRTLLRSLTHESHQWSEDDYTKAEGGFVSQLTPDAMFNFWEDERCPIPQLTGQRSVSASAASESMCDRCRYVVGMERRIQSI